MRTFIHDGKRTTYTNAGSAILSGAVVVLRSGTAGKIGIAVADIAASTGTGELEVGSGRVHVLTKKAGDTFAIGDICYWDAGNSRITSTATGNTRAGTCDQAAASAATTIQVAINT